MSGEALLSDLYRVCVKFYSPEPGEPGGDAALFVPIFHEWIRDRALDLVLIDVADYAHAPESPGIMLVCHEVSFALDRSDGEFGLLAQRRLPIDGTAVDAISATVRHALAVAERLERDPRVAGRLRFDPSRLRVEANDRLRAPNTDEGATLFEPAVRAALERVFPGSALEAERIHNDPRDRLAIEARIGAPAELASAD